MHTSTYNFAISRLSKVLTVLLEYVDKYVAKLLCISISIDTYLITK